MYRTEIQGRNLSCCREQVKGHIVKLMVQINLSLATVVLHSGSQWLMGASGYCIFLLLGDKVSACEVHVVIEEFKQKPPALKRVQRFILPRVKSPSPVMLHSAHTLHKNSPAFHWLILGYCFKFNQFSSSLSHTLEPQTAESCSSCLTRQSSWLYITPSGSCVFFTAFNFLSLETNLH